jgi:hypothetical protein
MTDESEPPGGRWVPEAFQAPLGDIPFATFVDSLPNTSANALKIALDSVLAARGIELAGTEWLKPLGKGLHEFRIRHDAAEIAHMFGHHTVAATPPRRAILLRLFVHFHGDRRVLLLNGYDKGADTSERRQRREIARARRLLAQFRNARR